MPRRISRSRLRSQLQRDQQKQRQALSKLKREVNRYNREVDNYNRKVRTHNARVRANRRKLANELSRLQRVASSRTVTARFITYQASVRTLHQSFVRLEEAAEQGTWTTDDELFDMAEGEAANSFAVLNALLEERSTEASGDDELQQTVITTELQEISPDLDARWRGALFALSPRNPDAARHFCTSCREILVEILNLKAPDSAVLAANSSIRLTQGGQVPRREKIYFCLVQSGQMNARFADFIEDDINNVMDLFSAFNPATHGEAGRYDLVQLKAIKTRVEGAIQFLHRIVVGKFDDK